MKKSGCALFGCLAVVGLLALAALAFVRVLAPETAPMPSEEAETEPPEAEQPLPQDPNSFQLTFRFLDPEGRPRRFSCAIRRADYELEEASFGYVDKDRIEELNRGVREILAKEAADRGVAGYFTIEVYDEGSIRWTWTYPGGTPPKTIERIEAFDAWLENDSRAAIDALEERYYHAHWMRLNDDEIAVDYERFVREATEPLADCFKALQGLGRGRSGPSLDLFLTFIQDLRYELPQKVDQEGRETLGFRVPTAVMVEGAGDCDSKSVVFCSLWRQLPGRVLLVLVPGHALVAVEGKPGPGQASVRLGNRYYILCEVAGPGRFKPGETDVSGSFEYVLIEPVRG
jgi:hypothetical protein